MRREPLTIDPEDDPSRPDAPAWMLTYGDMMSLLLCFFVMMLAFSTMERERFKVVSGFIRDAFGAQTVRRATEVPAGPALPDGAAPLSAHAKAGIFGEAKDALRDLAPELGAEVLLEDGGVRIRMNDGPLFEPASARLQPAAGPSLARIAALIREAGARATVEGHSDNLPLRGAAFPSNWELSAARAGAVVRFLATHGLAPVRLEAVGHADTRPVGDNTTETGRRRNRRVEILVRTGP